MDWKYKHFHQERTFQASRDDVEEAARRFMAESLGWKITETTDGFSAEGYSFSHNAIAAFSFQTVADGTRVAIELRVERAGVSGFMLFDVGGYYSIQIRKWLDGTQWFIHQKLSGAAESSANPHIPPQNKATACLFNGCLVFILVMFGIWALVTVISALWGLATGNLYLWARSGTIVIHGVLARIVSGVILIIAAWVLWRMTKKPGTSSQIVER